MRAKLSEQYIKGHGIEIGALHCPTPLFNGATAEYVDLAKSEDMQKKFPEVSVVYKPTIVDNAELLTKYEDGELDFLIANHVFEHLENPILAFKNWLRVLKPNGVIYAAIPDKNECFDRKRNVTSFSHLLQDYILGTGQSLEAHYRDWYTNSELEGKTGEELNKAVADAMITRDNVHFHVWDAPALSELFGYHFKNLFNIKDFTLYRNGAELIVICRKQG